MGGLDLFWLDLLVIYYLFIIKIFVMIRLCIWFYDYFIVILNEEEVEEGGMGEDENFGLKDIFL